MGVNGMVACALPLASQAGVRMLMDGGNDFDAAVATAAALNVCEPWSMSVGGAQGIQGDSESGVLQGGADPRRDGFAIGW